jgi:cytochrome c-type protein NapC
MSGSDAQAARPGFVKRAWAFLLELIDVLIKPSTVFGLGVLVFAGFVAGIIFWGAFNTALEVTNTEKFCTSCHEMRDNVFAELKSTIHFTNRSGVRASCPDCHVPHNWTDKIARKMQASQEVWGKLFGYIDTREKFQDKRLELALHEWARFKANDSLECRNCHSAQSMDITKQSPRASVAHERFLFSGEKTCIDCHKGIAHHLPDMRGVPGWQ